MTKEKKLSKMGIIGIRAIPLAATAFAAATAYVCRRKKTAKNSIDKIYAACPVCGVLMDKSQKKCNSCRSPIQKCVSCGSLFHGEARYCPKCGTKSKTAGKITIVGITYRLPINEPFPTHYISHSHCCCGTPFLDDAAYCQLCGRKRPEPGNYYLRERKSE